MILECGFCPITQVDETPLLIASHIKPWKVSDNIERINPKNGILLTPTYDKLFDRGYISFTDDKRLLVSTILSKENRQKLNLINDTLYPSLPIDGRQQFLNFHRNEIYKG
ncbi:HNH endonuclease [Halpernia sp. GG3]